MREASRLNFRSFWESISSIPEAARLHRALAKDTKESKMALKQRDNEYTRYERTIILLKTDFPGSTTSILNNHREDTVPTTNTWSLGKKIFSYRSVYWAISTFGKYKSSGIDGIWPKLLQNGELQLQ